MSFRKILPGTLRAALRRTWDSIFTSADPRVRKIGRGSPWAVRTDLIRPGATVVSGGVGKDISFELALARQFGCNVYLFDPSPTGHVTMSKQDNRDPRIEFVPLGLAAST